jgi:hypothetical protein
MTQHSHQTAPTQFVEADGIRFAYRRFGKSGGMPLDISRPLSAASGVSESKLAGRTSNACGACGRPEIKASFRFD